MKKSQLSNALFFAIRSWLLLSIVISQFATTIQPAWAQKTDPAFTLVRKEIAPSSAPSPISDPPHPEINTPVPRITEVPTSIPVLPEDFAKPQNGPGIQAPQQTGPPPDDAQSTTGPIPPAAALERSSQPFAGGSSAVLINDVPSYIWRHGCGPTAAGMLIGYWDSKTGYDWLIPGDASTQTTDVDQAIASSTGVQNHYTDYVLPMDDTSPTMLLDKSEPPYGDEHPNDSIADFMYTSQSSSDNRYGWSWFLDFGPALLDYVQMTNPGTFSTYSTNLYYSNGTLNWTTFKAEIDAGRPVGLLVDSNGDGRTDHFIPAFGYDETDGIKKYATFTTWDNNLHWFDFGPMTNGKAWGIYGAVTLNIVQGADFPPQTPQNFRVSSSTLESITLAWDDLNTETGYSIYDWNWVDTFEYLDSVGTNVTSYTVTGLACGSTRYYELSAYNSYGESTHTNWIMAQTQPCPPSFTVIPDFDWISGSYWKAGSAATIMVDNDMNPANGYLYITSTIVASNRTLSLPLGFDLARGQYVTVSDGTNIKSTWVEEVYFDSVNETTDVVGGRAPADRPATVIVSTQTGYHRLAIMTNPDGNWTADFDGLLDIQNNLQYATIHVYDDDDDATFAQLNIPTLEARFPEKEIHGYDWPLGIDLTISIDDPDNGAGTDYTASLPVSLAPWDSDQTWVAFTLTDFDLLPGQLVTMSNGLITKQLTVGSPVVEVVDVNANTVSGHAAAGINVDVGYLCNTAGCAIRRVTADATTGTWLADFSIPGIGPDSDEHRLFDIMGGMSSEVSARDADNDLTTLQWQVPAAPVLTAPAAALATNNTTPLLSWTSVAGDGITYELQLSLFSSFETTLPTTYPGTGLTYKPAPLTDGIYHWRVRALNSAPIAGPWSTSTFTIDTIGPDAPALNIPADNAFVVGTPAFSWLTAATATHYQFQYASDEDFSINVYTPATQTTRSHTPPRMPSGIYYWRVQARDTVGNWGDWSLTRQLTINPPVPAAPVLMAPTTALMTNNQTPIFTWNAVAGSGITYAIQISAVPDFASTVQAPSASPELTYTASTLPAGVYYWRVYALNSIPTAGPSSGYRSFTIDLTPPAVPVLSTPLVNASVTGTPGFSWQPAATATHYQFRYADDSGFFTNVYTAASQTTRSHTPPAMSPKIHYWQVRAKDAAGNWSAWSAARAVTIKSPVPAAPVLIAPTAALQTNNQTPVFTWNAVAGSGITYQIQISTVPDFASTVQAPLASSALTYTAATLPAGIYYWHVQALNSASTAGLWSGYRSFAIDLTPPAVPVLSTPRVNASVTGTPAFSWQPAATATQYQFQYADNIGFSLNVYIAAPQTTRSHTPPAMSHGLHYWQVRAKDAAGNWSAWSAARAVMIN